MKLHTVCEIIFTNEFKLTRLVLSPANLSSSMADMLCCTKSFLLVVIVASDEADGNSGIT